MKGFLVGTWMWKSLTLEPTRESQRSSSGHRGRGNTLLFLPSLFFLVVILKTVPRLVWNSRFSPHFLSIGIRASEHPKAQHTLSYMVSFVRCTALSFRGLVPPPMLYRPDTQHNRLQKMTSQWCHRPSYASGQQEGIKEHRSDTMSSTPKKRSFPF